MSDRRSHAQSLATTISGFNYLGGALQESRREDCFTAVEPATGAEIGYAPESGEDQVDVAVSMASRAFPSWSVTSPLERSRMLLESAAALQSRIDDVAALISLETGRAFRTETRPELENAVKIFRYFAGLALESKGDSIPYTADVLAITVRDPLGVVGAIVPWNVPAMLFCLKVAPALAAGNTVVVKPAEQAALASTLLADILGAPLPRGVLNLINGHGENSGAALVRHADVKKVSFTGSVEVGRLISLEASKKLIPVTLELGGKSPIVIFPDVSVDRAVAQTITGMRFTRQGQSCTSTTRILVHADLREEYLRKLALAVSRMRLGDPLEDETDIGSLVSLEQAETVRGYIRLAASDGVEIREMSDPPDNDALLPDVFVPATLLLDPAMSSRVVQEEIFGPVATVHSWDSFEEVVALANGTPFGLSACILTDSVSKALTLARRLAAGFIQVNSGMVIQPGLSFGGYGQSGLGREASLDSMLEAYTQVKTVIIDHSLIGDQV
jgi:aldehyde dehydrogenase (NAD+)